MHRISKTLLWLGLSTFLAVGLLYFWAAPRVTEIGDGYSLIQFLNGGGRSYLVDHSGGGSPGPTITELAGDETSVIEVRTRDGKEKSVAWNTPNQEPDSPFPATLSEMDHAGVLIWKIRIPDDLKEGEYATTEWMIGGEVLESGLSFEGIPAGQTATVVLWTGEYLEYYGNGFAGEPPAGMPYWLSYPGMRKSPSSRHGRLVVPRGWEEPYGSLASGDYADSGWLMLRCNRKEEKTPRYFANLEFTYRTKSDSDESVGKDTEMNRE